MNLPSLYQQAVAEGADLVIGPLIKENIKTLATTTELSIPVLALNNIPELAANNLYQLGLSPTDEAEQVATKAGIDGYKRALILVPENKLGQRVANHYAEQWQLLGNEVIKVQSYPPQGNDFTQPIKRLLNLDESEYRYKKIRNIVPSIKYTPRRRHDADVIFVTGTAKTMRLLNPQLQYFRANDIPVYATPQLYDGRPNPTLDIDLDGIVFCDAPWLFKEIYQGDLSMDNLQNIWQQLPASHLRLVALGIDVYQIIPHLSTLDNTSFPGATGNLQLTRGNHIKRNLVCAKFSNGTPKVIGFIGSTGAEFEIINMIETSE
jgi:outer membrane PBP1 activator LpoA protein